MGQKKLKRPRQAVEEEEGTVPEPTRGSEEEPAPKKVKWTNKTRVLVISARGIGFRCVFVASDVDVNFMMVELSLIRVYQCSLPRLLATRGVGTRLKMSNLQFLPRPT